MRTAACLCIGVQVELKLLGLEAVGLSLLATLVLLAGGCAAASSPPATRAVLQVASPTPPAAAMPTTAASVKAAASITPAPAPIGWKTYASSAYGVTLHYPSDWQPKQGYAERYAGKDGFFQVGAMSGEAMTIDQAAETDAAQKQRPYGSRPKIERTDVQGQAARVILPSDDQPADEGSLATLIVLAPRPLQVSGAAYRYLVLWADRDHILPIAKTLRFTAPVLHSITPEPRTPTPAARRQTGPASVPPSPRYEPLALKADLALEQDIRALLGPEVASFGVVVKRLSDGRGAQVNPGREFYAASLYKLLVMYEVFKQRQLGLLSFDDKLAVAPGYLQFQLFEPSWSDGDEVPIHELLGAMIKHSDNVAAMLLHDKVGGWNIIQDLRAIGLAHTDIAGDDMPTSAQDMALWLEMIARGYAVDQQSSREMVDLLSRQIVRDRLPALLPAGTRVANKTGNWENATHDVGIVYAPKGTYVIAVLSVLPGQAKPIAELSRLVYDHFEGSAGVPPSAPSPISTPLPATRPAVIATPTSSAPPARATTTPISASPTSTTSVVKVYFSRVATGQTELVPVERKVPRTQAVGRAAVEELLKGPTPEEEARGLSGPIPDGATLRSLKIVEGIAYADFDEALQFQVGGSARVTAIRNSIVQTLLQFATVKSVVISIEGRTDDILQP